MASRKSDPKRKRVVPIPREEPEDEPPPSEVPTRPYAKSVRPAPRQSKPPSTRPAVAKGAADDPAARATARPPKAPARTKSKPPPTSEGAPVVRTARTPPTPSRMLAAAKALRGTPRRDTIDVEIDWLEFPDEAPTIMNQPKASADGEPSPEPKKKK